MKTEQLPKGVTVLDDDHCPCCNEALDAVSSLNADETPEVGDITMCAYCGEILEFNNSMKLILVTEDSWNDLPYEAQNQLIHIRTVICKPTTETLH